MEGPEKADAIWRPAFTLAELAARAVDRVNIGFNEPCRQMTPWINMIQIQSGPELPLYRLYLLRASYLLLSVGQGSKTWPAILHHTRPWDFWHGLGMSFFGALTLLCLLGVRYPVRMMPLLIFEFTWKLIWVLAAWLPPYLGHTLDTDVAGSFSGIFPGVVVVPLVLPWGYLWKTYVFTPGDRWR